MSNTGRKKPPLVADKRTKKSTARPKPAGRKTRAAKKARKPVRRSRNPIVRLFRALFRWLWRLIWGVSWRVALAVGVVIGLATGYVYVSLPDVTELLDGRGRGSVTLLDRNGDVFAWRGDQFGGVVTTETVSRYLTQAIVATEDKRFYRHFGISPRGVASAVSINLKEGRGPLQGHGGSTITQQTAKLLCLGVKFDKSVWKTERDYVSDCRQTSMTRKLKEAIYALAMEVKYTKDEILSIYMNRAYFGGGAYGAEAAAQRYFGKPAAQLTPPEAAMLSGLLTAPSRFAPTKNLIRSQERAAMVLRLMNEQGYLLDTELATAMAAPAVLSGAADAQAGGYFADWIMASGPEFFTRDTTEDVIIRTTLDQRIQTAAEEAMQYIFEQKLSEDSTAQAAVIVMSADGAVRAMVGGREAKVAGAFNRATQANRQTGSAFKPFVYATALELGYSSQSTVVDEPYCLNIPGSGEWCPKNYTRKYRGRMSLTDALKYSLNIPAVKVSESVGRDLVRKVANDFGIESDLAAGPALALGASESTLIEMAGAYAGILNGGSSVTPYGLVELRLLGSEEALMDAGGGIGERVIREKAARELIYMMQKVVAEGSGRRAALPGREVAGKTGTTQGARDAWFLGFTADYVAGVWMGYDNNTPLTGVTGGGLPAEIWYETMVRVHEGLPVRPLPMLRTPEPPANTFDPEPATPRQPQPDRDRGRPIENILRQLLGGG